MSALGFDAAVIVFDWKESTNRCGTVGLREHTEECVLLFLGPKWLRQNVIWVSMKEPL